jgi:aerobic C4-dicarboxylate transport protein
VVAAASAAGAAGVLPGTPELQLSVDWFIGMARAAGNLIGNCVATAVIAAWEGDLDHAKAAEALDGHELVDVTAG